MFIITKFIEFKLGFDRKTKKIRKKLNKFILTILKFKIVEKRDRFIE